MAKIANLAHKAELEYLGLTEEDLKYNNPFKNRREKDIREPHIHVLRLMSDPANFYWTCKTLFNGPTGRPLEIHPFQCVMLKETWFRTFPMWIANRGAGKSFLLGLYAMLRGLLVQGSRIVITGSGFRQAKTVFNYAETLWNNSPVLRSLVSENPQSGPHHDTDRWWLRLGDSVITALPLGDGQKIRGERANVIIADEFASIPRETFETVVAGFGVVELDPIRKVKDRARIRVLQQHGQWTEQQAEQHRKNNLGNQTLIAGTAYYQFNHFAEYWKRWHGIVSSLGDPKRLAEVIGNEVPDNFNWRDYSVFRMPVELLPEGFMDERQIARSMATMHSGVYTNEFGACFSNDSNGFFKRSLVEGCVTHSDDPIVINGEPIVFRAMLRGNPEGKYVFGIDPASEHDRFSIVILELHPDHRRVVFCWTTTRQDHKLRIETGLPIERDFYSFCARKIRDLMKVFPCEHISLDSQGGGIAVIEALHDPDKIDKGEQPIWPIGPDHPLSDGKEKDTDTQSGLHIVEMVNFARAEWTAEANHGLRKDMEDKILVFPMYDAVVIAGAMEEDNARERIFDTLEDAAREVEEIKEELATIVHTQTPGSLRDRWDTPEVKLAGSKKGRLRKDRYSSLVMANSAARRLDRQLMDPDWTPIGGFAEQFLESGDGQDGPMIASAPDWYKKSMGEQNMSGYGWVDRSGGVE